MSWQGKGGFFGAAHQGSAMDLGALRQVARDAYGQGRLSQAADAQAAVLALATATGGPSADDFLFAGLIQHQAGRLTDGIAVLLEGATRHPTSPALRENLAVLLLAADDVAGAVEACETALTLGTDSPNVHDCLCEAHLRAGRLDLAVRAGRLALEAKDRRFGPASPVFTIPPAAPPAFDPGRPEENVIAYSLWGNAPRYQVPLLENARLLPHLFPEWTIRVYHDRTVDPGYLQELAGRGVQLQAVGTSSDIPAHRGLLWRFAVAADPSVRRFLVRDADSLLTVKERVAVDAWLQSGFHFHAMRDWYSHTDLLLAGMWGGVGGILPSPADLLAAHTFWRMETDHIDQDILAAVVWPVIRRNILIHDSIFHPCLDSVPFPPFGALPAGHHVGQNAFLHFTKSA
ncbi:MAG TPA: hypothetical protein DDZ81_18290 [Acetobacteraceae bacterium]|jgi:hypothetical protein|nr:hypothetical protein [Acetobacteraceae bacterium]